MPRSRKYTSSIPTKDTKDVGADFQEAVSNKAYSKMIDKLRRNENRNPSRIDIIEKIIEVSLETNVKGTVANAFLKVGNGVSLSDVTSSYGGGSIQERKFGNNTMGVFFEEALFGGGEGNTPFSDVSFRKMLKDIDSAIKKATNINEKAEFEKIKASVEELLRDDYYKNTANIFNSYAPRLVGRTKELFRPGVELKAGKHNPQFFSIHAGSITIPEPGAGAGGNMPTEVEAGNRIFYLALKVLYEKMDTLLYISYLYEQSDNDSTKNLLYLIALDLFHELSIDKAVKAMSSKLIKVYAKSKFSEEKNTGNWYQTGALGFRTYSIGYDFSDLNAVLEGVAEEIKNKFLSSTGMTRDRLRAAKLYNQDKVLYERPGTISDSLFEKILTQINPGEGEWLVNPNDEIN